MLLPHTTSPGALTEVYWAFPGSGNVVFSHFEHRFGICQGWTQPAGEGWAVWDEH